MNITLSNQDEIFTPLLKFVEVDEGNATLRQVHVQQHHKSGVVKAETTKLPNCIFNLDQAINNIDVTDINVVKDYIKRDYLSLIEVIITQSFPQYSFALRFLRMAIRSRSIEVTEIDASVLHDIYQTASTGLPGRYVLLADLQKSTNLNAADLDQSLQRLEQLKCIQLQSNKVILTEQIVFERVYHD